VLVKLSEEERARIAAEYGVIKVPQKAKVIPQGVYAIDPYSTQGWEEQRQQWFRQAAKVRKMKKIKSPSQAMLRRAEVRKLHAKGMTSRQIAETLDIAIWKVWADQKDMKLQAKKP
jgi:hypothetical protein